MIQYDPHRWFDHLFDVKGSLILEITPRVLACTLWAGVVVALDHHVRPVGFPSTVHTLVGTVLGLPWCSARIHRTTVSGKDGAYGAILSTNAETWRDAGRSLAG